MIAGHFPLLFGPRPSDRFAVCLQALGHRLGGVLHLPGEAGGPVFRPAAERFGDFLGLLVYWSGPFSLFEGTIFLWVRPKKTFALIFAPNVHGTLDFSGALHSVQPPRSTQASDLRVVMLEPVLERLQQPEELRLMAVTGRSRGTEKRGPFCAKRLRGVPLEGFLGVG